MLVGNQTAEVNGFPCLAVRPAWAGTRCLRSPGSCPGREAMHKPAQGHTARLVTTLQAGSLCHTQVLQHQHQSTSWPHPEGQASQTKPSVKEHPTQEAGHAGPCNQGCPMVCPGHANHPALSCGHKDSMEGRAWPGADPRLRARGPATRRAGAS